jgi:hypothetical protein
MMRLINKLIARLIQEIKKPSESPPKLIKTNNSVALRTSFQALLYWHIDVKKKMSHELSLVDKKTGKSIEENHKFFSIEIVENNEEFWLRDFRWYKNRLDVGKTPKSSILCVLFWLEKFIKWHWEVAYKVIQTKRNTENFLDEYGTRWISYSDLIMTIEDEFYFLEEAINNIYDSKIIKKEKKYSDEFAPKYSILRMMWRIWGKYVMKRLLPAFIDKIKQVLDQYHNKLIAVASDYKNIIKKKYAMSAIKNRWSIDTVMRELLLQSVQMIVDVSLNEISINYIESTAVQLGIFYPQVEEEIISSCCKFLGELKEYVDCKGFETIAIIHFNQTKSVFPKTTQRKIYELIFGKWVSYLESKIRDIYNEFSHNSKEQNEGTYLKLKERESNKEHNVKIKSGYLKHILGNHDDERISSCIKSMVLEWQSGNELLQFEDSDIPSISDDEEFKLLNDIEEVNLMYKIPLVHTDSQISEDDKEKIALFYVYLMSIDKECVIQLNKLHNEWIQSEKNYEHNDRIIQRENVTRRIPEHLDEKDKLKFQLIRQASSFDNDLFYKQYVKPDALEMMRKHSSVKENEEYKCVEFDLDDESYNDEFDDDDLDSLLLSSISIPIFRRD